MTLTIRSRNAAGTRRAILTAARHRFVVDGYDHAGLRAIAADAGVDPALICRYFGGKERLFAEVLETTAKDPMEVLAGDRETFGDRVARALLDPAQRSPDSLAFIELAIRSGNSPVASKLVHRHIETRFIEPFAEWLGGERAAEKAWLIGSVLMGASTMLVIGCAAAREPREVETAVARLARLLQRAVDDD